MLLQKKKEKRKTHLTPSSTLPLSLSQLTLTPHYIDWERCSIGEVVRELIDHIDPPCEPWENVELHISYSQKHIEKKNKLPVDM